MNFFELKNKTITKIDIGDTTIIETSEGKKYQIYHPQDCCETVSLIKIIGDVKKILNSPVILAEEDSSDPVWYKGDFPGSHSWTNYFLETEKGRLEIYFLGESNGYYSETMDFQEILSK